MSHTPQSQPEPASAARRLFSWRRLAPLWPGLHRFLVSSILFVLGLSLLSDVLSEQSGLSPLGSHLRIELPLLLLFFWLFLLPLRRRWYAPIVAGLPLAVLYLAGEVFFVGCGNVLRIIDVQSLPELFQVLPFVKLAASVLTLVLPVLFWLLSLNYRRPLRILASVALATLFVLCIEFKPALVLAALDLGHLEIAVFSDAQSVNDNGRFTMILDFEASRRVAIQQTASYRARPDFDQHVAETAGFLRQNGNRRNVYLIVLESFLDPTLFANVTFSRSPRNPEFEQLVGDKLGYSISPVFGGQTAQAEFEVLCGVPAMESLSEIEFDVFTGHRAGCMPDILEQAGYATYAGNVYEPDYFNSNKAYLGTGFQSIDYPLEYARDRETYLTVTPASDQERYLFDGDLFDQQLSFLQKTLRQHPNQPIFSYVLTMYGHEPHDIDTTRRPLVLSMQAPRNDQQLLRAANQHWYRTQAIARYLRQLTQLDPHSLIILVSDHVPPLDEGTNSYKDLGYLPGVPDNVHMNRILVLEDGRPVRHQTIHHYELPTLVYSYLTGKRYCVRFNCQEPIEQRQDEYRMLIARAVSPM